MKKSSVTLSILKLLGMIFCGCILWLFVFLMLTPEDYNSIKEPFKGASVLFGSITGLIIGFVINFNKIVKLHQKVLSDRKNIDVLIKRNEILLDKANRVVDKYITHESETLQGVAEARSELVKPLRTGRITTSIQFKQIVENYPELKANESIMELLRQITQTETEVANQKIYYNELTVVYNAEIHSFPTVLYRKLAKFDDAEFYSEFNDAVISDEALGI